MSHVILGLLVMVASYCVLWLLTPPAPAYASDHYGRVEWTLLVIGSVALGLLAGLRDGGAL